MSGTAELDWNERWKAAAARKWPDMGNRVHYWNRRADAFASRKPAGTYVEAVLERLAPEPGWSVLDVGCGTGTLALPLARRVRKVTAMDFSEGMLAHLTAERDRQGLGNLHVVHAGWEDDWDRAGIGPHDVAIASRSLVVADLAAALEKLDRAARRRVLIVSPAGDGPADRGVLRAIGRSFQPGPDYIYVYNLLHQSGIFADVHILKAEEAPTFGSPGEALAFYRGLIEHLQPEEAVRLARHLEAHLVRSGDRYALEGARPLRWALIGWEKGTGR